MKEELTWKSKRLLKSVVSDASLSSRGITAPENHKWFYFSKWQVDKMTLSSIGNNNCSIRLHFLVLGAMLALR